MFTLTDPRLQAISQAGQQFGTGLGETLVQGLVNQRLAQATQGFTPETPVNEVLQSMAKYNVPAEAQERYFSPVIQQRMQAQHAMKIINDAVNKKDSTPKDLVTAIAKAQALSGNLNNASGLLDFAMGDYLSNQGSQGDAPAPQGTSTPSPSGRHESPDMKGGPAPEAPMQNMSPEVQPGQNLPTSTQGQPNQKFPGVLSQGVTGSEAAETVPGAVEVQPYTPAEKAKLRNANRKRLGKTLGDQETDRIISERDTQHNQQVANASLATLQNANVLQKQENIDRYVEGGMARDYSGNRYITPEMTEMAKYHAREVAKGTPDQRWNQTKKWLDDLADKQRTIEDKIPSRDFLFRPPEWQQEKLKRANVDVDRYLDKIPEGYKRQAYDQMRTRLRSKPGVGPIKAEWMISYPSQDTLKSFGSLPTYWDSGERKDSFQKKLEPMLINGLSNGTSPLILKDLVVTGKGWPDSVYDDAQRDALKKMREKGLSVPDYNETALNDTNLKFQSTPYDQLTGQSLLGPLEFHR